MTGRSLLLAALLAAAACGAGPGPVVPAVAGVDTALDSEDVLTPPEALPHAEVTTLPEGALILPQGVPLPLLETRPDGSYLVTTPCGNQGVATTGAPVSGIDVVIDPGHGGEQPGAVGPTGLPEKVPNLEVSLLLAGELQRLGHSALLTRTADYRLSLATRAAFTHTLQPRAFVSVHFNAEPDELRITPGAEIYFQHRSSESRRLAGLLYEEVFQAMSRYEVLWAADFDAGVKPRVNLAGDDYYAMLRLTAGTPAALTESAFISNAPEEALLRDSEFRGQLARAMARGVDRFLTTTAPGSGFVEPYERDSPVSTGRSDRSCVDPPLGLKDVEQNE